MAERLESKKRIRSKLPLRRTMGAESRLSIPPCMVRKLRQNLALKACTNGAGTTMVIGTSSGWTVKASTLVPSLDKKITTSGGKRGAVRVGWSFAANKGLTASSHGMKIGAQTRRVVRVGVKNGLKIWQRRKAGVKVGALRANVSGMRSGDAISSEILRF